MATEFKRMKQLFDSTAGWAANNIVMLAGEVGIEDTGAGIKGKVGDGVSTFSALPYSISPETAGAAVLQSAAFDFDGSTRFSDPAGWSATQEEVGKVRVTFPGAASTIAQQSITATVLHEGVNVNGCYCWVTELTTTDCLVNVFTDGGVFATRNFSIQRVVA